MEINKDVIRWRFRIGQEVEVKQKSDGKFHLKNRSKGTIVGIYEHFIVLYNGKYCESYTYVDIAIGGVEAKVVKAA